MKKSVFALLVATCLFLCVLSGIFIGRNLTGAYIPINKVMEETNNSPTDSLSTDGKIDINTASLVQLQLLPGVGPSLAQRIIDYRTEHGSFSVAEDLLNVSGIGEKKLSEIKPYIFFGG